MLEISRKVLGEEHHSALVSMKNLAMTYGDQGKHSQALELLEDCYKIEERLYEPNDGRIQMTLGFIAEVRKTS